MSADYWCEQTLLIVGDGPKGPFSVSIEKPFARIGSHESSEVVLRAEDEGIAGRCLYLHATNRGIYCVDLVSSHSAQGAVHGWLRPAEVLHLGPYRISARLSGDDGNGTNTASQPEMKARGTAPPPYPVVVLSTQEGEIGTRRLTRRLTIVGRQRPSSIRLTSHTVSAAHCAMYWDGRALWVVDLLSGNGTRLDGSAVEAAVLPLGSTLALGRVELRFLALSGGEKVAAAQLAALQRPPEETAQGEAASTDVPTTATDSEEDSDHLPDRLTNCLIRAKRRKVIRRRALWLALFLAAVLFVAAGGAVVWMLWGEDVPVDLPFLSET
ncbi:MAG: FHA domain-containing protein [Pirellulales bacterium]|nr:FHA domain-containing protein [Pirellulales bacterium]